MNNNRVGYGYDVHRLIKGSDLIIGGVKIPFDKGLEGHSDADVLLHAIADALLGACGLGDIGQHFPDTEETFKDIDSRLLLGKVGKMIREEQYMISNIDATVVAERPRLAAHIPKMRKYIADDLNINTNRISVKATTSEGIGFEGKGKGISARAVVLLSEEITSD